MKIFEIKLSEEEIETLLEAVRVSYHKAVPTEQEKLKSVIGSILLQKISRINIKGLED